MMLSALSLGAVALVYGGITLYAWAYYTVHNLWTYHYHKRNR